MCATTKSPWSFLSLTHLRLSNSCLPFSVSSRKWWFKISFLLICSQKNRLLFSPVTHFLSAAAVVSSRVRLLRCTAILLKFSLRFHGTPESTAATNTRSTISSLLQPWSRQIALSATSWRGRMLNERSDVQLSRQQLLKKSRSIPSCACVNQRCNNIRTPSARTLIQWLPFDSRRTHSKPKMIVSLILPFSEFWYELSVIYLWGIAGCYVINWKEIV